MYAYVCVCVRVCARARVVTCTRCVFQTASRLLRVNGKENCIQNKQIKTRRWEKNLFCTKPCLDHFRETSIFLTLL